MRKKETLKLKEKQSQPKREKKCQKHNSNEGRTSVVAQTKESNPKDMVGNLKMPFSLFPPIAISHGCLALLDGAMKYGRQNWRAIGVRASIYFDACMRHLNAWYEGEDNAPDSGVHHLGHAMACIAILLDAQAAGKLNDDRAVSGGYLPEFDKLNSLVKEIKARHADKNPKHYTIQDEV